MATSHSKSTPTISPITFPSKELIAAIGAALIFEKRESLGLFGHISPVSPLTHNITPRKTNNARAKKNYR
jgi:hypothetical protein